MSPLRPRRRGRRLVRVAVVGFPLIVVATSLGGAPASAPSVPKVALPVPGYRLLLEDTFPGQQLNASDWNPYLTDSPAQGAPWNSNGEGGSSPAAPRDSYDLEYDDPSQLRVDDGLRITATQEPTAGDLDGRAATYAWRSGAISSYGKVEFDGGLVDVVAKVPTAPGMWPGIFLLPGKASGEKTDNFEIDVFEGGYAVPGEESSEVDAWTLHTPSGSVGARTVTPENLGAGYHDFGIDWVPGKSITWYLDGAVIGTVTSAQAAIPNEPMELLVDLQVASGFASSFHSTVSPTTPPSDALEVRSVTVQVPTGAP